MSSPFFYFGRDLMITVKVGGSSLRTKTDFLNVRDIIKSDERRKAVVVSSPGRRFENDEKVTDLLISACEGEFSTEIEKAVERFRLIFEGLSCEKNAEKELLLLKSANEKGLYRDFILSRGEYISALIMAHLLDFKLIDAKDVIFFKRNGKVDEERSREALRTFFSLYKRIVIPGFYGQNFDGRIKTFPRGGSDITGSLVSSFLNAEKYENMTDTEGLFKYPPKFFSLSPATKVLSLYDLKLLAHFGASVFNEGAVKPLIKYNVPLEIKNTFSLKSGTFAFKEVFLPEAVTGVGFLEKEHHSLILITGKAMAEGSNEAFILNSLSSEAVEISALFANRKTPSLIIKVPNAYFKKALCIVYKITALF